MKALPVNCIDMSREELHALTEAVDRSNLAEEVREKITSVFRTIEYLLQVIEDKSVSIRRLIQMIFGGSTESSKNILEKARHEEESPEGSADCLPQDTGKKRKKPVKGHGRNSSSAYTGAERVSVSHSILKSGSPCPLCPKGKVYGVKTPGTVLRFVGRAPVEATVYELEKLRCNLCGEIFTAGLPEDAGEKKYDEKGGAMIALLKYGSGFPFHRLEKLQSSLGMVYLFQPQRNGK
jgi:transposase